MRASSIPALITVGFSLIVGSSAYKVIMYSNDDCTGDEFENNVWDNTCSTPSFGFNSLKPTHYGGSGQSFTAYSHNSCAAMVLGPYWADGGDEQFQIDECISLPSECNALGSRLGGPGS